MSSDRSAITNQEHKNDRFHPLERRDVVHHRLATSSGRRLSLDRIITATVGTALMVTGFFAATWAAVDGPMDDPGVMFAEFTHTATLGAGMCLLICAFTTNRLGAVAVALALAVCAITAQRMDAVRPSLALQPAPAWLVVTAAAAVVIPNVLVGHGVTSRPAPAIRMKARASRRRLGGAA